MAWGNVFKEKRFYGDIPSFTEAVKVCVLDNDTPYDALRQMAEVKFSGVDLSDDSSIRHFRDEVAKGAREWLSEYLAEFAEGDSLLELVVGMAAERVDWYEVTDPICWEVYEALGEKLPEECG